MSVTYDHGYDRDTVAPTMEENYIPVYARRGKGARKPSHARVAATAEPRVRTAKSSKGGVKTWMILAPIGALVVGGAAAWMLTSGGEDAVSPAETVAPAALTPAPSVTAAPLAAATPALVEATTPAPAPVTRAAAPVRREAPAARRAAPAPAADVSPAARTPTVETPLPPTSPQPYSASATSSLNTSPPNMTVPRPLDVRTQPLN